MQGNDSTADGDSLASSSFGRYRQVAADEPRSTSSDAITGSQQLADTGQFAEDGHSMDNTTLLGTSDTQNVSTSISEYSAAFLITNAALGAGLLNFPLAFHEAGGIGPGNIVHLFFVAATVGSLYVMALTAARYDSRTYQQMVEQQCGTLAGHLTSACIAVYCLITCITFIIIVGDQTDRFFADIIGPDFCNVWYYNRLFTMTFAGLLVFLLSLYKDMANLAFMGYVGSVFMVYLVGVIVYVWAYGGYTPGRVVVFDKHQLGHLFDVLPTISFGYQCHVSSVPIYHSITNRNKAKYFKACTLAMLSCAVVYTLSANFGYLTFGSKVADDLLLSYDNKHVGSDAVSIAIIALAFKSVATYPVLMFCVREAVVSFYVAGFRMTNAEAERSEPCRRYVVVTGLWLVSLVASLLARNIDVVVRLLGSLAAFFIFVIPGVCLFMYCNQVEGSPLLSKAKFRSLRFVSIFYILLGVFTFGLSVTLAVQSIVYPPEEGSVPLCVVDNSTSLAALLSPPTRLIPRLSYSWGL